jgi:N-acetylneuraminic acid mutarotase
MPSPYPWSPNLAETFFPRSPSPPCRRVRGAVRLPPWLSALIVVSVLGFARHGRAQSFTTVAPLNTPRTFFTATWLPGSSSVVAAAGYTGFNGGAIALSSAELYDPAAKTWTLTGSLTTARRFHTATLLSNGDILVASGIEGSGANGGWLGTAELYDPSTGLWSATGSLATGRSYHTATLLASGQVLVVGGYNSTNNLLSSAELYNPGTGAWSPGGSLANARENHTATLLPNGMVLVVGGEGASGTLASAELYNPSSNSWSLAGSLASARQDHTATLLSSGQVLAAGGSANLSAILSSAELYNPSTNAWSAAGSLVTGRQDHCATLLASGQVLVAGGANSNGGGGAGALSSAELYNPASNTWSSTGSLAAASDYPMAALLAGGSVLVAGGLNANDTALSNADLFGAAVAVSSVPALPPFAALLLAAVLLTTVAYLSRQTAPRLAALNLQRRSKARE